MIDIVHDSKRIKSMLGQWSSYIDQHPCRRIWHSQKAQKRTAAYSILACPFTLSTCCFGVMQKLKPVYSLSFYICVLMAIVYLVDDSRWVTNFRFNGTGGVSFPTVYFKEKPTCYAVNITYLVSARLLQELTFPSHSVYRFYKDLTAPC